MKAITTKKFDFLTDIPTKKVTFSVRNKIFQ